MSREECEIEISVGDADLEALNAGRKLNIGCLSFLGSPIIITMRMNRTPKKNKDKRDAVVQP